MKIGLCATMSPGLKQKCNRGRPDIQLYQNPDDGDEVNKWNEMKWNEMKSVSEMSVDLNHLMWQPEKILLNSLAKKFQETFLGPVDKLNPPPIKWVLPLFRVGGVKLLINWRSCSFIIRKRRSWNHFKMKSSVSSQWNSVTLSVKL